MISRLLQSFQWKVAGLVDSGKAEELDVSALDGIFDAIMA